MIALQAVTTFDHTLYSTSGCDHIISHWSYTTALQAVTTLVIITVLQAVAVGRTPGYYDHSTKGRSP